MIDLLGPDIAAGKRLNIHANGAFDHPCSYIRIPPETLNDKVEGDRRRLNEALQKLDEEVRPLVASVVAAAQGDVDPDDRRARELAAGELAGRPAENRIGHARFARAYGRGA
ncbi:MAG: hypothetical protein P4L85_03405 [Paludisphaera borealis]|uniref:hypothetical protein n=1 Tax=Paludisphaera borealis TaxID=1387353 RepID=UPI00284EE3A5|nr:hypothetical protein [Paludisphaera borealis]MDR3618372.1 hypothetical protein [Paludisphaera borealis]